MKPIENSTVSVIIPIYNTGTYLKACIDSICQQTYGNLQILLIDDGSEYETAAICDELALADARIEVIHKKNEGVSIARNCGLARAEGKYVCFVDSDDTIEPCMIERLVSALDNTGAQIAMCDATTIAPEKPNEEDTIKELPESCILNHKNITPAMLTQIAGSAWRCAYRRTAMLAKQAKFPVGIKFSEDRIFNIIAIGFANKIAYIKESYYNRLIRKGSACFRFYPDMTEQIVKMRDVLLDTVEKLWGKEYLKAFECQIAGQIHYSITNYTASYSGLSLHQQVKELKQMCENPAIQSCITNGGGNDIRSKMILNKNYILLTILGVLTNKYHKLCKIGQYR